MPAAKSWTVKPGWNHRAFLGSGPFSEEEFAAKLADYAGGAGWSAVETAARASQAYEQATAPEKGAVDVT